MSYEICIYHFYIDGKKYHIIYKNRPFLRIKNCLIVIKNFVVLKYKEFLGTVKELKNKLFFMVKKARKYFHYKYLSLKYRDINIKELNELGNINFSQIGREMSMPEMVLGQLSIEFSKLKVVSIGVF